MNIDIWCAILKNNCNVIYGYLGYHIFYNRQRLLYKVLCDILYMYATLWQRAEGSQEAKYFSRDFLGLDTLLLYQPIPLCPSHQAFTSTSVQCWLVYTISVKNSSKKYSLITPISSHPFYSHKSLYRHFLSTDTSTRVLIITLLYFIPEWKM